MNDEHGAGSDDVTDPDQDARIRALLAELGSGPDGEPIPPEVAARLDDTLAMLVAERGRAGSEDESTTGNVVPLRRRWLPRAAAAAAAVIVLGVGGVAVANLGLFGTPLADNTASDSAGESAPKSTDSGADSGADSSTDSGTAGATALPELSAATFASDVAILLEGRASVLAPEGEAAEDEPRQQNRESTEPGAPGALRSRACPGPEITDGAVPNQVRYDGRPAVLLIHPERGGRQVAEAWNCAGDRKLASTTVTR